MRRHHGVATTLLALALVAAALLALALPTLAARSQPTAVWRVEAVEVVPVAGLGEPLLVIVDASCGGCREPLLQLRVCPLGASAAPPPDAGEAIAPQVDEASCDVAARRPPAAAGVTRLRYARALTAGLHRVEVLFLARDAFGASRSLARTQGWVDVR